MPFAPYNLDLSYWRKQEKPLFADLAWNLPERKTGRVAVVGGNAQSFSTVVRAAEFCQRQFPFEAVTTVLPDALRAKLPVNAQVVFAPSTTSGSFERSVELREAMKMEGVLLAGDVSRNAETAVALAEAAKFGMGGGSGAGVADVAAGPIVVTRDAVEALSPAMGQLLTSPRLVVIGSLLQMQKMLRDIYYPRMVMLSQPLVPVLETLHKLTLSYPATILTFHQEQVIVAQGGEIVTTPLAATKYSPLSLWAGQLAATVLALNFYNPGKSLEATAAAVLFEG